MDDDQGVDKSQAVCPGKVRFNIIFLPSCYGLVELVLPLMLMEVYDTCTYSSSLWRPYHP